MIVPIALSFIVIFILVFKIWCNEQDIKKLRSEIEDVAKWQYTQETINKDIAKWVEDQERISEYFSKKIPVFEKHIQKHKTYKGGKK